MYSAHFYNIFKPFDFLCIILIKSDQPIIREKTLVIYTTVSDDRLTPNEQFFSYIMACSMKQ